MTEHALTERFAAPDLGLTYLISVTRWDQLQLLGGPLQPGSGRRPPSATSPTSTKRNSPERDIAELFTRPVWRPSHKPVV